jgi:hypothetical protein
MRQRKPYQSKPPLPLLPLLSLLLSQVCLTIIHTRLPDKASTVESEPVVPSISTSKTMTHDAADLLLHSQSSHRVNSFSLHLYTGERTILPFVSAATNVDSVIAVNPGNERKFQRMSAPHKMTCGLDDPRAG